MTSRGIPKIGRVETDLCRWETRGREGESEGTYLLRRSHRGGSSRTQAKPSHLRILRDSELEG